MWLWTEAFDKASAGLSFVTHSRAWFWCSYIWHTRMFIMTAEKLPVNSAICPRTGFYLARSQPKIKSGTLKNLCLAQKRTKRSHTHPSAEDIPHRSLVTENLQLCFCERDNSVYLRATNTHTNTRTFKHIYKRIGIQEKKETVPS